MCLRGEDDVKDESMADGGPGDVGRTSAGDRGVEGSGDPARRISPEEAAREAELEQLGEQASQVAARLPGLTLQSAAAVVTRTPALHIRFIEEGERATEEDRYGRITAFTRDGVVTEASAW